MLKECKGGESGKWDFKCQMLNTTTEASMVSYLCPSKNSTERKRNLQDSRLASPVFRCQQQRSMGMNNRVVQTSVTLAKCGSAWPHTAFRTGDEGSILSRRIRDTIVECEKVQRGPGSISQGSSESNTVNPNG